MKQTINTGRTMIKIKNYHLFVVDVEYTKNLHKLHSDLSFLPERIKINKCTKFACNLNDR